MAKAPDRKFRALRATYRADPLERKKAWIRDAAIGLIRAETEEPIPMHDDERQRLAGEAVDLAVKVWDLTEARLTADRGNGGDEDD